MHRPHSAVSALSQDTYSNLHREALLADEDAADDVWEAWDKGEIDDVAAWVAWMLIWVRKLSDLSLVPQ